MRPDSGYATGIRDFGDEASRAWGVINRSYIEKGEILIACISVTQENDEPCVQFVRHGNIQSPGDLRKALDALEYAVRHVRKGLFGEQ